MKQIHIECKPDETLVKNLGFTGKSITHHQGKSTIFRRFSKPKIKDELAMVDEDPGKPKTKYEKSLNFVGESHGIKHYEDKNNNKVIVLKGKLEDWINNVRKQNNTPTFKGLPMDPDELHRVINRRTNEFEKLLDFLLKKRNPSLLKLKGIIITD